MDKLFSLLLLTPFLWVMVYQDSLNRVEELKGEMAEQTIQRATELASVEGYYTPEIIEGIENNLLAVGFSSEEISLELTLEFTERGEYVEGKITVPNKYTNILTRSFFSPNDETELNHVYKASRMSEALE